MPISSTTPKSFRASPGSWLKRKILQEKLQNPFGLILFLSIAVCVPFVIAYLDFTASVVLLVSLAAIPSVYAIVAYPRFGMIVTLVMAYLIFAIIRLGLDFPAGVLLDGIEFLLVLGFFIKQKQRRDWSMMQSPMSIMMLLWIIYNVLQVLNPTAESYMAWLYTIRSVALVTFLYFIFAYHIRTVQYIRLLIGIWLVLALAAALYAFKQQFFGFSASELAWLTSDPAIADLLFIGGEWRKFSFLSDPVVFSYNMVITSLLAFCVSAIVKQWWLKLLLIIGGIAFLVAMLYSGTRGAFVLVPSAIAFYAILRFNMKIFIGVGIIGAILAVLIFIPTSNPTIYRFQTAFKPAADASFTVREINQKKIRPYILSHPMGGGLGATGVWGQRFAPDSYLAGFPPDSGYVRVAVELGWIGLLLYCILLFVILVTGIRYFFRMKDPELKTYCLAMTLIVFVLNVGNYPQEALVQFPNNIYFYLVVALIHVTYRLDQQKQKINRTA
ncbi:O-antigen ligase family protein [Sediminibacterium ginsengisoli]|nr:O-antigen ligase family protein [Sediminibacterium ginsengisoli]